MLRILIPFCKQEKTNREHGRRRHTPRQNNSPAISAGIPHGYIWNGSVLLPESFAAVLPPLAPSAPALRRASPECHPSAVPVPESVTPSVGRFGRSSADIVWLFICPFAVDNYTRNKHKLQDLRDENPQFIALTKKPRPSSPIFWLCAQEEAGRPLLRRSPPRFGHAYASGSGSWAGWVCSAWANCSSRSASSACRAAAA